MDITSSPCADFSVWRFLRTAATGDNHNGRCNHYSTAGNYDNNGCANNNA